MMKNTVREVLSREDQIGALAVTTAIVRLYARQTADEQNVGTTRESNGRGFSAFHAKQGTYFAQYALGQSRVAPALSPDMWDSEIKKLKMGEKTPIRVISGRFLEQARKIALRYVGQLTEEAEARSARNFERIEREAIQAE